MAVTGAPNLLPYVGRGDLSAEGLYAPYALEGATLYDGHKDGRVKTKLKGRPLRGIYNDSMLCSEKELGISDEHEGIILMQGDTGRGGSETPPSPPGGALCGGGGPTPPSPPGAALAVGRA
mgnify:CR=1 FL=1